MAWRNTKPSDYAPKSNAVGELLTGFASVYAPAKIAKDKREAEQAYEKEKADAKAAKDAADKAATKDLQDKKDVKIVSIILREQQLDPTKVKTKVQLDILKDVQIMGKDAISYYGDPERQFSQSFAYGSAIPENTSSIVDASISNVPINDVNVPINDGASSALNAKSKLDTETETLFPATTSQNTSRYQPIPMTTKEIIDLGGAGRIAALEDSNISAEDKKLITNWQTANQSILDEEAEKIPYADIKADNYLQIAAGFRDNKQLKNGEELAQKVITLGKILVQSSNKPLTLPEINQLDLDVLEGSVKAGGLEESQAKLFKQIIKSKYNKIGRELSKLSDADLQGVRDNTSFQPLENRNTADAILKGRKTTFDIKDWDNIKGATLDVAIGTATGEVKSQLEALKVARAESLIEKRRNEIPWETLDSNNYAGVAKKYPDYAREIERIAIANTRGIFKPDDIANFTVAQLKSYETSALPGIEGYRSLITDTLKQKEQEQYQGISDKSTDELIALTQNTLGYNQDVRDMATNMVSARKEQGFDINALDASSIDVLKAMESDNRIPQVNRDLIKNLREGKESSSQSFRYYAEKVSNQSEAITALDLAMSENAPIEVITKLTALKDNHTKAKTIADRRLAGQNINAIEDAVITMTDGTKKYIQARLTNEGKLVPLDESLEGTVTLMSPFMADAFTKAKAQMQKDTMAIANNSANISEALRNSELAISIAENSPMVRNAGGVLAQFSTRLFRGTESAFNVAGSLLNKSNQSGLDQATGETVTYITEADFLEGMKSTGKDKSFLNAIVSQDVQKLADETSRFEATMIILAFRSGRIEGQSGNAMSNKDFERLTQMLETKGSVTAFTEQLRGYMKSKVLNYDDTVLATMGSNSIPASFKEEYGFYPVTSPLTFSEFVEKRNEPDLTTAYQNTMAVEVAASVVQAAGTKDDPILVSSPEEGLQYPAGTIIKTPEGQLLKVPQKADN